MNHGERIGARLCMTKRTIKIVYAPSRNEASGPSAKDDGAR